MVTNKRKKTGAGKKGGYNVRMEPSRAKLLNLPDNPDFYCHAIERSGGIPFYLRYGPQPAELKLPVTGNAVKRIFGIPPEEFTEKSLESLAEKIDPQSEDVPEELRTAYQKLRTGGIDVYSAEMLLRTASGESRWFSNSSLPVIDPGTGRVTGIFGILLEVNDGKLISENLKKVRQKEEECDRLKISFLQNISHEIRTPLNAIVGFSSLLAGYNDGIDTEHWNEFREIIISNSDRLLDIIDSLMEISKIESGTLKSVTSTVNLNWLMLKVYAQFRVDASDKGIALSYVAPLPDHDSDIETDGHRLTRILVNLVDNALKFTNEGRIEFGYTPKDGHIEFYVADTGIGIPATVQDNVFRMFYQADSSYSRGYGGMGLGLAIAKAYVGMLGGEIWFISQPGEGTVFMFTIPHEKA